MPTTATMNAPEAAARRDVIEASASEMSVKNAATATPATTTLCRVDNQAVNPEGPAPWVL